MFHVCSHRHVSGHTWTVNRWKQVLDYEELYWAQGDSWAGNFMTGLKMCKTAADWVQHHLKGVQQWTCYKACCLNLEWFCHDGDMLNQVTATDEIQTKAYTARTQTTVLQIASTQSPPKHEEVWQKITYQKCSLLFWCKTSNVLCFIPFYSLFHVASTYDKKMTTQYACFTFLLPLSPICTPP